MSRRKDLEHSRISVMDIESNITDVKLGVFFARLRIENFRTLLEILLSHDPLASSDEA